MTRCTTAFGELARRRLAYRESEVQRQRDESELSRLMQAFQDRDEIRNTAWSRQRLEQNTQRLAYTVEALCPDFDGQRKTDALSVLTTAKFEWGQAPISLDTIMSKDLPSYNPYDDTANFSVQLGDTVNDRKTNFLFNDLFYNQRDKLGDSQDKPVNEFFSFAYWLAARAMLYGFEAIRDFISILLLYYPDAQAIDAVALKKSIKRDGLLKITDTREFIRKIHADFPEVFETIGGMLQTYSDAVRSERSSLARADRESYELGVLPDDPVSEADLRKRDLYDLEQRIINAYRSCGNYKRVAKAFIKDNKKVNELLIQKGVIETHGGSRKQRDYATA